MEVLALALGGCLSGEPSYGLTEDTGGHITYVLGAMRAISERDDVTSAEIVTRRFDEPSLGSVHAEPCEILSPKLRITRIASGNNAYLAKDALAADRAAFTKALIAELSGRMRLPEIIHAHFADAAEVAAAVRSALGIPFIYTAHSLGIDKAGASDAFDTDLRHRIAEERRAMVMADAIIGSSRDECERQLPAYGDAATGKVHRLPPGIEQRQASETEIASAGALIAPFLRDPAKPILLAIARPVKKKNLISLVQAYADNAMLRGRANLVILPGLRQSVETGEREQVEVMRELVDAIDAHDLHGSVAYPRRHDQHDVRGLYALAARSGGVFVNPALIEPFGLTILEAAVHGLPVVATRYGGPVDIVADLEHGLLIDPRCPPAIGDAIAKLMDDESLWRRCSANGRQNVSGMCWSAYAKGFCAIARQILGRSACTAPTVARSAIRRLLLCDIDNTLTGCRSSAGHFGRYMREHPEIRFGVATGRSLVEARRIVREWELPQPAIWVSSVGSEIYWQTGQALMQDRDFAHAIDADWQREAIAELAGGIAALEPQPDIEQRTHKLSYFADRLAADELRSRLDDAGIAARVIFSHGQLLDILPETAGKAAAMHHVARKLGLPREAVVAAGDSGNDLDMIAACANGIVVANAEPELAALSTRPNVYLAGRPHAAGVLEGLRRISYGAEKTADRQHVARGELMERAA